MAVVQGGGLPTADPFAHAIVTALSSHACRVCRACSTPAHAACTALPISDNCSVANGQCRPPL
eukprot:scaffold306062_cov14-Tisochrysis_lutea.AAC.1